MSESKNTFVEAELNSEKCRNCKNIFSLDEFDQDYQGSVATYDNNYVCTVECISNS